MKLDPLIAALATALLATAPGPDGTWAQERFAQVVHPSCTSELQRCLDKLDRRIDLHEHGRDWSKIESALVKLLDTDPECALLLQGTGLRGL